MSPEKEKSNRPINRGPLARLIYAGDADDAPVFPINSRNLPLNRTHTPSVDGLISKRKVKEDRWGNEIITLENY